MGARSIAGDGRASSCYFRTTADGDSRKALIQIDERCNLHCAHCFVSANEQGQTMGYDDIVEKVIPRLNACRVDRVTLTGGEPTIHPEFLDVVRAFRSAGGWGSAPTAPPWARSRSGNSPGSAGCTATSR